MAALPLPGTKRAKITAEDDEFLEDLSKRSFRYFWDQADATTGLVLDRARGDGTLVRGRNLEIASTTLTGFYLTALCVAAARGWKPQGEIRERCRSALRHLANDQEHVRGWYFHFVDRKSGSRAWDSELSSIDTAFLLAGVISAQQFYAADREIADLAQRIYSRVDFPWLLNSQTSRIRMGWTPESGFLRAEWTDYDENSLLTILGIGSPTYPLPAHCWYTFRRGQMDLEGYRFIGRGPIFIHQFPQVWLDLRGKRDGYPFAIDYHRNSAIATYAIRQLSLSLRGVFPTNSESLWGVTPSDSDIGYVIWGSPLSRHDLDGTIVPCAAAGSLMFTPEICLPPLQRIYQDFGDIVYGPYGFADSFHPLTNWVNPDVLGLDVGITLFSAENLRSGGIWNWFNQSPDIQRAMNSIFTSD